MKRILSTEEREKSRQMKTRIVSFIMLGILIFSSVGYAFFSQTDSGKTQTAQNQGNQWIVNIGDQQHTFSTSPDAAKETEINNLILNIGNYQGKEVYISSDNDAIAYEISSNMGRYASRIQPACFEECEKDLPEKTCNDLLIVLKNSEQNKVYQQNNCVFIEGDIRAADAFLYRIFGIL